MAAPSAFPLRTKFRVLRPDFKVAAKPSIVYTPVSAAQLYGFPAGDGAGQTVGIIELGGAFITADYAACGAALGITMAPVTVVLVDGATQVSDPQGADIEVALDTQIIGAIANKANIRLYFAPNSSAGFLHAIQQAAAECSVVSISWGGPISSWSTADLTSFEAAFAAAAAAGVTNWVASGDNGSMDGSGVQTVDFPAASKKVCGCGGTSVPNGLASEVVWNDGTAGGATGGGVAPAGFGIQPWQNGLVATETAGTTVPLTTRGVPDVAGLADENTGYTVYTGGATMVVGGTSAVAPLWAGLHAVLAQVIGKPLGFVVPNLYAGAAALNDVTQGNNGRWTATPGWDACTGLGSPNGAKLVSLLSGVAPPTPVPRLRLRLPRHFRASAHGR